MVYALSQLPLFYSSFSIVSQGIDLIAGGKSKKTKRTGPKSDDIYLKLLVKEDRIAVLVGAVTDDTRVYEVEVYGDC
ncbi:hypothetical protein IFM89_017467 [Coptis chinensis]|uniref:Uncharacterized protein n=1 Tax=Coptis chinensis TaxID=261450 RepID=A0A835HW54_9MAGN|nr:hypothetical protein IFM89_017467 [Coptis chinensis]